VEAAFSTGFDLLEIEAGCASGSCVAFVVAETAEADGRKLGLIPAARFVFAERAGQEEVVLKAGAEVIAEFDGSFAATAQEQSNGKNEREEEYKTTNEKRGIHGMDHWVLLCAGNRL
jgi:hypothetical protein